MPSGSESSGGLEPVVDQTLVASLPDRGARGAATSSNSPAAPAGQDEIEAAMAADTWRQREAKMLARSHGGGASALSRERRCLWRQVYLKREAQEAGGGEDAAAAAAQMYWDTVKTCFGSESGEHVFSC